MILYSWYPLTNDFTRRILPRVSISDQIRKVVQGVNIQQAGVFFESVCET